MPRPRCRRYSALVPLLAACAAGAWLPPAPPAGDVLTGRVLDSDGRPVAGATVRLQATPVATRSGSDGAFRLVGRASPARRVTAARDDFFIAGAPAVSPVSLILRPLPVEDHEGYAWVDPSPTSDHPQACARCHAEIYREWADSPHARGSNNVHLRNLFGGTDVHGRPGVGWSLLHDHPDGAGVCNSCHLPSLPLEGDAAFDLRLASGVPALGVHCDYCHKVRGLADGRIGLSHGRFYLDLLRPRQGQVFFGPLDDVPGDDAQAPVYRDSRYCASCHEGVLFGVPVYTTYSEWLDSPAARRGQSCQSCHMAPTGRMTNIAPGHGGVERDPRTLASHRMDTRDRLAMLQGAVRADLRVRREAGAVTAEVMLRTEGVGHRTPTGFIDRHLVAVLEVTGNGRPVGPATGPLLPPEAGAELRGRAGRLYGRQLRGFDGSSPAPFWRAEPAGPDTRLRPGKPDRWEAVFPGTAERATLRVLARRFWPEVARAKGWTDNEVEVLRLERAVPQ